MKTKSGNGWIWTTEPGYILSYWGKVMFTENDWGGKQ